MRSSRLVPFFLLVGCRPRSRRTPAAASTGEAWQIVPLPQSSRVLARDGSLIGEIGREIRTSVSLKSLPWYVPKAFIAVEDQRFYEHNGVDARAVAGAIIGKIVGNNRGGGSTITQQLVGYMHPDIIDRRDLSPSAQASRAECRARDGAALHQRSDPRGVPQSDQPRSRLVRRRSRVAGTTSVTRPRDSRSPKRRRSPRCRSRSRITIRSRHPDRCARASQSDPPDDGGSEVHLAGSRREDEGGAGRHRAERRHVRAVGLLRRCGSRSRPSAPAFR